MKQYYLFLSWETGARPVVSFQMQLRSWQSPLVVTYWQVNWSGISHSEWRGFDSFHLRLVHHRAIQSSHERKQWNSVKYYCRLIQNSTSSCCKIPWQLRLNKLEGFVFIFCFLKLSIAGCSAMLFMVTCVKTVGWQLLWAEFTVTNYYDCSPIDK